MHLDEVDGMDDARQGLADLVGDAGGGEETKSFFSRACSDA
jgi:hypothetical protein